MMDGSSEKIADALASDGFYVGESIFSDALSAQLALRAQTLRVQNALSAAKIGRASEAKNATAIRSDHTRWLDDRPEDEAERESLSAVNGLRESLNAALFLGATRCELHFAHYAPGAFYATHRDRFGDDDARIISLVFYLNDAWRREDGGELVLYESDAAAASERPLRVVAPQRGTMVAFRSEMFPHQVLPSRRDRLSLTGWLRRR